MWPAEGGSAIRAQQPLRNSAGNYRQSSCCPEGYLVDLAEGKSAETLAITVVAPEDRFDEVIADTAPIIGSIEFHAHDDRHELTLSAVWPRGRCSVQGFSQHQSGKQSLCCKGVLR